MSAGVFLKSIMNMLITSFPPRFHFPSNDSTCGAEKHVCRAKEVVHVVVIPLR